VKAGIVATIVAAIVMFFSCDKFFGSKSKSKDDAISPPAARVSPEEINAIFDGIEVTKVMSSAKPGNFLTLKVSSRESKTLKGRQYSSFDAQIASVQRYPGQIFHRAKLMVLERPEHIFATTMTIKIDAVYGGKFSGDVPENQIDSSSVPVIIGSENLGKGKGLALASPSASPSPVVTTTPEPSATPSPSPTTTTTPEPSATPSPSPTTTTTPEPSSTPSPSPTVSSTPSPTVIPEPSPTPNACSGSNNRDEAVACCAQFYDVAECENTVDNGCNENPPKWPFCKPPSGSCSEAKTEQQAIDCCVQFYGPEFCQESVDKGCDSSPPKWPFCVGDEPNPDRIEECLEILREDPVFNCVEGAIPGGNDVPTRDQMEQCGCTYIGEGDLVGGRSLYDCGNFDVSPVPGGGKIGVIDPNNEGCMFDFEDADNDGKGGAVDPTKTDNCFECHDTNDPFIPPSKPAPSPTPMPSDAAIFLNIK